MENTEQTIQENNYPSFFSEELIKRDKELEQLRIMDEELKKMFSEQLQQS